MVTIYDKSLRKLRTTYRGFGWILGADEGGTYAHHDQIVKRFVYNSF
jgi:hypothetical protein